MLCEMLGLEGLWVCVTLKDPGEWRDSVEYNGLKMEDKRCYRQGAVCFFGMRQ